MNGRLTFLPLALFAIYGVYYYYSHRDVVPITGRKHMVDMNPQQEDALGYQSYQQILHESKVAPASHALSQTVKSIGQRIAKVSEDPGYQWDFNVIISNQVNAFCLPGGKVAVYTGIIPVAKTNDGLAIIMGHEIAHAIARHGAERMAQEKLVHIGQLATGVAMAGMDSRKQQGIMAALGIGAQFGLLLPFSRKHESEADYMGLVFAARACFDPREATEVWRRMGEASHGQPSEYMSTHPSHERRIAQFEEWMPKALEIRQQNCPN
jgi:metalloendopeptidase OMA1, mitochondrial